MAKFFVSGEYVDLSYNIFDTIDIVIRIPNQNAKVIQINQTNNSIYAYFTEP